MNFQNLSIRFVPSVFVLLFFFWGCRCKTENYDCPELGAEIINFLTTIENTNYIFESDSGKRLILKTVETRPEKEETETCSGTRNNCKCEDCNASSYF